MGSKLSCKAAEIGREYFLRHGIPDPPLLPIAMTEIAWLLRRMSELGVHEDTSRSVRRFYIMNNSPLWRLAKEGNVEELMRIMHQYWQG